MSTFNNNLIDPFSNAVTNILRSLKPLFFNNDLINLSLEIVDFYTPSSDYNAWFADRESGIIWGRHENDSLVGFEPGVARPGQRQIDLFFGDFLDEELYELFGLVG